MKQPWPIRRDNAPSRPTARKAWHEANGGLSSAGDRGHSSRGGYAGYARAAREMLSGTCSECGQPAEWRSSLGRTSSCTAPTDTRLGVAIGKVAPSTAIKPQPSMSSG